MLTLAGPAVTAGEPDWLRAETDGVVLISDANRKDATEFLVGYLAYRRTFSSRMGGSGGSDRADQALQENGPADALRAAVAEFVECFPKQPAS